MRQHLTYANVTATLALFFAATTGGAYAAKTLVGSKDIKNNSVSSTDLKNNSVTGTDIKDASIGPKDLSSAAKVSGPAGPKGDTGPAGAPGANGTNGTDGADGILKLRTAGSKISAGSSPISFGSITPGNCSAQSTTSLTLNPGDTTISDNAVVASPKTSLPTGAVYTVATFGSAQIVITICNVSGGANIPAGERVFNWIAADTN